MNLLQFNYWKAYLFDEEFAAIIGIKTAFLEYLLLLLIAKLYNNIRNALSSKQCLPVHGKQGEELLFGQGNDKDYYEDNMSSYIGAENVSSKFRIP